MNIRILCKTTMSLATAFLAATSVSEAAVINVDIQGNNSTGSTAVANYTGASANGPIASDNTWNYFNTVGVPDAGDSLSVSGVTITFGDGWTSSYSLAGDPNNLQGDRAFTTGSASIMISGLDTTKDYNLALIAGPANASGFFASDFTIGGDTKTATATTDAGPDDNGALTFTEGVTHVLFSGLDASSGSITFTTSYSGPDGGAAILAGLQLEAVAVPEPATGARFSVSALSACSCTAAVEDRFTATSSTSPINPEHPKT